MADRLAIARALREMATLLEVAGQEPFRARAYARGAEALERLDADLGRLVEDRRLTEISGIGPGLAGMISELYRTGRSEVLEEQRRRVPPLAQALHGILASGSRRSPRCRTHSASRRSRTSRRRVKPAACAR